MIEYENDKNQSLPIKIIYKPIKNIYLRVNLDGIKVTTNKRISEKQIKKMIEENFDKLYDEYQKINIVPNYNELTLWEEVYEISYVNKRNFKYEINDNQIIVYGNTTKSDYKNLINRVLISETKNMIKNMEAEIKNKLVMVGLNLVKTKVRHQKSRYGCCYILKQEIVINSFLARINPIYLKYVLFHEYAHLLVPNHSKSFYEVLDILMDNHKTIQKELKKIAII